MTELKNIDISISDAIATVTLNRPPVNAVTQEMYREIRAVFSDENTYLPDARVVVLTGAGKHFCSGNDLTEFQTMTSENAAARMETVRNAFFAIRDCVLPVIGAVHGVAVGTGLAIAASCDVVLASRDATFSLPEVGVGVLGGAKHATRLVPQNVVRYLHLTGDALTAEALARYGGVHEVTSNEDLMPAAYRLARRMSRHSAIALRYVKRSLNGIEFMDTKSGYIFEQGLSGEIADHPDAKEAVNAFFERREPNYSNTLALP
ncbi:enoyl-CoA hydratase-related protein [Amycolatopsis sp. GM8]|uniref:enoyl-CoA hydratase-related protein n=1 Tax=Amycolatopsis sp. GM8 TaxID=2896530 RepID=UPI001F01F473|nr:enoyl-CoA hydratase-related protein [Amycolatopsis sp. GM8]